MLLILCYFIFVLYTGMSACILTPIYAQSISIVFFSLNLLSNKYFSFINSKKKKKTVSYEILFILIQAELLDRWIIQHSVILTGSTYKRASCAMLIIILYLYLCMKNSTFQACFADSALHSSHFF